MFLKDVILFSIKEHLMKFNTQKRTTCFERLTLICWRFLLLFVNSLTLYLHLTSAENLKDLAGTRVVKTKRRVKLKWKKAPSLKNLSLIYYPKVYPYLDQIFFVNFSSGKG